MKDHVEVMHDAVEAREILEMMTNFVKTSPEDPTKAQLRVMVGLLHGGISGALALLRDDDAEAADVDVLVDA